MPSTDLEGLGRRQMDGALESRDIAQVAARLPLYFATYCPKPRLFRKFDL